MADWQYQLYGLMENQRNRQTREQARMAENRRECLWQLKNNQRQRRYQLWAALKIWMFNFCQMLLNGTGLARTIGGRNQERGDVEGKPADVHDIGSRTGQRMRGALMATYKTPKMLEPVPRNAGSERAIVLTEDEPTHWEEVALTEKSRVALWEQVMVTLMRKRSFEPGSS